MSIRPLIALLTDFGTIDPYVGVMKGVILGRCPEAQIVDLTHEVPPQAVSEGAFWLERSFGWFREGTVFVAVVDPGVGTERRGVVACAGGRTFVGPDNGLLAPAVAAGGGGVVCEIDPARLGLPAPGRTFHGRDVFAPVAAELAAGRLAATDVGARLPALRQGVAASPVYEAGQASGVVVTVDRFGNLITNVVADRLGFEPAMVDIGARTLSVHATYANGGAGAFALVSSFGVVEVAVRDGSAAAALGLGRGERVVVRAGPPRVSAANE